MRKTYAAIAAVSLFLAIATPALGQESMEVRLIKGSIFTGTASGPNNAPYQVRMSFVKSGEELLAQVGSLAQVPAKISGNGVSFKYKYQGRDMEAQLTLHDNGELKGTIVGVGRSGALFRDMVFLMPRPR